MFVRKLRLSEPGMKQVPTAKAVRANVTRKIFVFGDIGSMIMELYFYFSFYCSTILLLCKGVLSEFF